jgi:hypothetical protein
VYEHPSEAVDELGLCGDELWSAPVTSRGCDLFDDLPVPTPRFLEFTLQVVETFALPMGEFLAGG